VTGSSVVLVEFSPSGGLFQFAVQLGEALAARGHRVELLTGPRPELATTQPGFTISPVLPTWHPAAGAADSRTRRRLRRGVRAVRYHLAWLVVIGLVLRRSPRRRAGDERPLPRRRPGPWLIARLRRRPVLVTVAHAPLPWNEQQPTGTLHKEDPFLERCLGVGYRNTDAVIVLGEQSAADLVSRWPDVRHVHIVPHGNEQIFVREEPTGAATTEPLVLFFGTLQAYKGLDLLLDAFGLVRAERPDARLLIAGAPSGDTDMAELRRRSAALGGVELRAGYVPLAEVAALFAGASHRRRPVPLGERQRRRRARPHVRPSGGRDGGR
jgi:glycosyltransferase involved in cell wall biosynthesis